MKYKGLLFDLDGVLVNTAKYHYLAWKKIAEELGIDFSEKDNERLKGVSREKSFEIILEIGGVTLLETEKKQYCARKNAIYLSYINQLTSDEILPGVCEFLDVVKQQGYKIALGSASRNSRLILDRLQLSERFDAIVDGTVVAKAKPDPEVFIKGAQALGLLPGECIVFEDAAAGIEAAHRAGMKAVGIGSEDILSEADVILSGFQQKTIEEIEEKLVICQKIKKSV